MKPPHDVSRRRPPPEAPPALRRDGPRWPLRPVLFALAIAGAFLSVGAALFFALPDESGAVHDGEIERLLLDGSQEASELPPYFYDVASRPASLTLSTSPEGALATLNEETLGPTPVALDALRPGYYELRFHHPDHEPLDTSLYIASGAHYAFDLDLVPLPVPAMPEATPVRGAAPGGRPARETPTVRPERRTGPTPSTQLGPFERADPETMRRVWHTGSLSVASRPAGARVLVNGQARGQTPLTLGSLRPGPYTVTLSLRGYETEERAVQVGAGAVLHVEALLTPNQ